MAKRNVLAADTPVYYAFAFNLQTGKFDRHIGIGTREVIAKHGLGSDGIVHWCCGTHWWLDGKKSHLSPSAGAASVGGLFISR